MSYHRPPQACHTLSLSGYSNSRLKDLNQLPLRCSVELSRLPSGDSGMSHKRGTILSSSQWDHRNTPRSSGSGLSSLLSLFFSFAPRVFETGAHWVGQVGLELTSLLLQPPELWGYRPVPPAPV